MTLFDSFHAAFPSIERLSLVSFICRNLICDDCNYYLACNDDPVVSCMYQVDNALDCELNV